MAAACRYHGSPVTLTVQMTSLGILAQAFTTGSSFQIQTDHAQSVSGIAGEKFPILHHKRLPAKVCALSTGLSLPRSSVSILTDRLGMTLKC